jgi:hypothetical protein
MENYKVGQLVSYKNGSPTIYSGIIVKVLPNQLVIIDDEAGMILYNAGYSVGDCVSPSQIINPIN